MSRLRTAASSRRMVGSHTCQTITPIAASMKKSPTIAITAKLTPPVRPRIARKISRLVTIRCSFS